VTRTPPARERFRPCSNKCNLPRRMCPRLCTFSDAGMPRLSMRSGGRRPKSAKAQNRGEWDWRCRRLYGELSGCRAQGERREAIEPMALARGRSRGYPPRGRCPGSTCRRRPRSSATVLARGRSQRHPPRRPVWGAPVAAGSEAWRQKVTRPGSHPGAGGVRCLGSARSRRRPVARPASPCNHRETRGGPLDDLLGRFAFRATQSWNTIS
jgi:hypothetical protein